MNRTEAEGKEYKSMFINIFIFIPIAFLSFFFREFFLECVIKLRRSIEEFLFCYELFCEWNLINSGFFVSSFLTYQHDDPSFMFFFVVHLTINLRLVRFTNGISFITTKKSFFSLSSWAWSFCWVSSVNTPSFFF